MWIREHITMGYCYSFVVHAVCAAFFFYHYIEGDRPPVSFSLWAHVYDRHYMTDITLRFVPERKEDSATPRLAASENGGCTHHTLNATGVPRHNAACTEAEPPRPSSSPRTTSDASLTSAVQPPREECCGAASFPLPLFFAAASPWPLLRPRRRAISTPAASTHAAPPVDASTAATMVRVRCAEGAAGALGAASASMAKLSVVRLESPPCTCSA